MKKSIGWAADLGSKLKKIRLSHKVKQIDLARHLGISPAYLNLIESNKRPMNVEVLEKMLAFFDIDIDAFMSASEGAKLQSRFEEIQKDPFFQGNNLGPEEQDLLAKNASLSNLIFSVYDGFKNARQELALVQRRLFSEEQDRAEEGGEEKQGNGADRAPFYILDRTAYDEVTDFLEHHHNYFDSIERAAEEMLAECGADHGRSMSVLGGILQRRFDIEVVPRTYPPGSDLLRLYNEKERRLYLSNSVGQHRMHFQLAHFIGLMTFENELIVEDLINVFGFKRGEASRLVRVNLANYFAGAMLLPYAPFLKLVQETNYDIEAMEGYLSMPFEAIAHRLCTLSRPGAEGIPLHFIRTDIAGNISKKYSGTGLRIDDRRGSCPKWAVHTAFLTPSILRRQYSVMPDGNAYFCVAKATVQRSAETPMARHAISVGIGCRAEDAPHMAASRGMSFENPERDGLKVGITCRLCDRTDCAQRSLPSFNMEYEINTMNRKENVLSPISAEDLLLVAEETRDES